MTPLLQFPRRQAPRRMLSNRVGFRALECVDKLFELLRPHRDDPEQTVALYLNAEHRVIALPDAAYLCDRIPVSKRADQIGETAIALGAYGVLIGSNHPTGDRELPNLRERSLTGAVDRTCCHLTWVHRRIDPRTMRENPAAGGLRLIDHFVVGDGRIYSFLYRRRMGGPPASVVPLAPWREARALQAGATWPLERDRDAAGTEK